MAKIFWAWFFIKTALCGCDLKKHNTDNYGRYKIRKSGHLSKAITESSGLEKGNQSGTFLTHNDSGGKPQLFVVTSKGKLLETHQINHASANDWEDLASGSDGRLFIGDFGNNGNQRRDLKIYIVSTDSSRQDLGKITFRYGDQYHFPPGTENRLFDCEAFFYFNNSLYLFTKRNIRSRNLLKLYSLPATPGDYTIYPIDSLETQSIITSADINPSESQFAVLSYGKIQLFNIVDNRIGFQHPADCIRLLRKQTEAILFENDNDLIVTNEQRMLYTIRRK